MIGRRIESLERLRHRVHRLTELGGGDEVPETRDDGVMVAMLSTPSLTPFCCAAAIMRSQSATSSAIRLFTEDVFACLGGSDRLPGVQSNRVATYTASTSGSCMSSRQSACQRPAPCRVKSAASDARARATA